MNFDLSEDEELLKACAERFVSDTYDMDRRRSFLAEKYGFSRENWQLLGDLGLIAAPFAGEMGGMDLDATGIATVFEVLGRGMVVEPLIENVLLAGRLFAVAASPELRAAWLPDVLSGARRIAFAHAEARARAGQLWIETAAKPDGDGVRMSGAKAYVPAGAGAGGYVVSARTTGAPGECAGVGLYFVPADAPGLGVTSWRWADGGVAVSLTFADVAVPAAHCLTGGAEEIADVTELANLARSAEALGIMERIFADTQDYLRTREQFGARLASFQAVQHRMVAQYSAIEQGRALLNLALVAEDAENFTRAVQGARAYFSAASVALGHEMIQFHGGMGVTDELAIGQGHKRLLALSRWPDDPDAALDRFAGVA